jgi:hypothetical protein
MTDKQVKPADVTGSGTKGRIMKHDVLEALGQAHYVQRSGQDAHNGYAQAV